MLPFLKNKRISGIAEQMRKPDVEESPESEDAGLQACAEDLIAAIESKDSSKVASALRAAFDILESEPHEELEEEEMEESE